MTAAVVADLNQLDAFHKLLPAAYLPEVERNHRDDIEQ